MNVIDWEIKKTKTHTEIKVVFAKEDARLIVTDLLEALKKEDVEKIEIVYELPLERQVDKKGKLL